MGNWRGGFARRRKSRASPCNSRGSFDRPGDELCRAAARDASTSCVALVRCCLKRELSRRRRFVTVTRLGSAWCRSVTIT